MSTYLAHCSALTHIAQKDGQLYSVQKQNILVSNFNVDVYKYILTIIFLEISGKKVIGTYMTELEICVSRIK